jgi:hypothetical protein
VFSTVAVDVNQQICVLSSEYLLRANLPSLFKAQKKVVSLDSQSFLEGKCFPSWASAIHDALCAWYIGWFSLRMVLSYVVMAW